MSKPAHILLVEDDQELSQLTQEYLHEYGYTVSTEADGHKAIDRITNENLDLILLDIMLPGLDGIEVCKAVRSKFAGPILMLSARSENIDQVIGLEIGADEYLCKPVDPRLLATKIKAHLRREARQPYNHVIEREKIQFGFLIIDNQSRQISYKENSIQLSAVEFDLMWLLASNAGVIKSRVEICDTLSGTEYDGQSRAIDIHISQLRNKLEHVSKQMNWIKTVRGRGYLFLGQD